MMTRDGSGKAPTIKDVAREAGVSFKTVSRVINRNPSVNAEMRRAVEGAMRALNYRPHQAARALRSQRSYSIALLAGWATDAPWQDAGSADEPRMSEFLGELMIGCSSACRQGGYHLIFEFLAYGDERGGRRALDALLDNLRPDALLLPPPLCDVAWLLDLLEARGLRHARLLPGTQLSRGLGFGIDDRGAAEEITRLLLEAGHRNLAMIAGPPDHFAASERRRGFEAAVAGVHGARGRVIEGDFFIAGGRRAALDLLGRRDAPTAIFAANDAMAAGVLAAAAQLGVAVPAQLSVAGFDDTLIARLAQPGLTTVRQPVFEMGAQAAARLIADLAEGAAATPELVRLDYAITRRGSIGVAPSS